VKAGLVSPVPRVCLTRDEAAMALGVSLSHFQRHIAPELRTIRSGSVRLFAVAELEAWADRQSTLAGGSHRA
jgi:excisionase family DNA binding protein